jgi:hypothetical protein
MSNRSEDILFHLIRSLKKEEKRHFKLYINRSSANQNLKVVQLFDALDKLKEYDEKLLLKKLPEVNKSQLFNLKAHLYKQVLSSLRLLKSPESIDLQLHEQFDFAHILYKKGLFLQSLRILARAKEIAKTNQKTTFLIQLIGLEKRIESLHITRSLQDRAEGLSQEALEVIGHVYMVTRLSNLALELYSWYIKNGHVRNEEDEVDIKIFFKTNLPDDAATQNGFYEKMYLYQSYTWYAFIRQDFLMYYRYTQKWVDLFYDQIFMQRVETGHFIKGLHNLLNAHFDLRNYLLFEKTLSEFEAFAETDRVKQNENFRIQSFLYLVQAKINHHFMKGSFKEGLLLISKIEEELHTYDLFIDRHRLLVLNYKIATLYFGSTEYGKSIDYLQKILNTSTDLRYDLQCYARVLHLLCHFELGNYELMEHLTKSVYRFMSKMQNFTIVEEEMFKFLRRSFYIDRKDIKAELKILFIKIEALEKNRFETRAFAYLDIISWLKSKVYDKPMNDIIGERYTARRKQMLLKKSS